MRIIVFSQNHYLRLISVSYTHLDVYKRQALIDALDTSVADFEAKLLGTPQYIGEQKAAKQKREKAINACEEIMTNDLDMIVEILKHENPETYAGYQHARKVKMMGRRTMALKIKVVESNSKNRVPGVNITIVPDTNGDALKATADLTKTVKRTSALGEMCIRDRLRAGRSQCGWTGEIQRRCAGHGEKQN